MNKTILKKYANLLIKSGLNVQKGQDVLIFSDVSSVEFIRLLVNEAYKAKANNVRVIWNDDEINKIKINKGPLKTLKQFSDLEKAEMEYRVNNNPCMLHILSASPESLKGLNQEKRLKIIQEKNKYLKVYREKMDNKYQWCIAGYPSKEWAKIVFPELKVNVAYKKLMEAILYVSRVKEDPIKEWKIHDENLKRKYTKLNQYKFKSLHYTSKNGTDLKIGLISDCLWLGGSEYTKDTKIEFNPNIPSEEVFTTPKKGEAEGIVYSVKPLSYNGQIIDEFFIEFKNGKAVRWDAKKNKELLTHLLSVDENASYLGECALVPYDSPINNSNILFYNTLYDENASCHLAVGRGFSNLIKDYEKYTAKELKEKGINSSSSHVDFMIGAKDLKITGIDKNNKEVVIFENGNWSKEFLD